jgi:hypothetical protein
MVSKDEEYTNVKWTVFLHCSIHKEGTVTANASTINDGAAALINERRKSPFIRIKTFSFIKVMPMLLKNQMVHNKSIKSTS